MTVEIASVLNGTSAFVMAPTLGSILGVQGKRTPDLGDLYEQVSDHRRNETSANMQNLVSSESFLELQRDFSRFQSYSGPNETFWLDFIEMVLLLLCFIRSTRTRNWQMHIQC